MRFYYFSLFSWIAWALYGAIAITVLSLLWARLLKFRFRSPVYWVLIAAVLVAPWSEELWIAYNFEHFCREAVGMSDSKEIAVEGFYDDTHSWRADKLETSGYSFMEGRDGQTLWRHEYVGNQVRSRKISEPTARYRYSWPDRNMAVAHKIYRREERIVDAETGQLVASRVEYGRTGSWLFIALGDPGMTCPSSEARIRGPLYSQVLKPMAREKGK